MDIGVVIVTFNRLEKLKVTLNKFEKQFFLPSYIIVVNNASTDGTKKYLDEWSRNEGNIKKIIIHKERNTGGSGGFYVGLKEALTKGANWIWVSDDDAYPEEDALYKINDFLKKNVESRKDISAICGEIINNDKIDLVHRRRIKKRLFTIKEFPVPEKEYVNYSFNIDEFSYVGVVLNKQALEKVGITDPDFFIWFDDTEHSLRLSKIGKIVCIPSIRIHHDTGDYKNDLLSWKRYYELRNQYFTLKNNFPNRYSSFYYFSTTVKYLIKKNLKIRSNQEIEMYKAALYDMRRNIKGINEVYRPGWKFKG